MPLRDWIPASAGMTGEGGDAGGWPAERFRQTLPTTATGGPDRTPANHPIQREGHCRSGSR